MIPRLRSDPLPERVVLSKLPARGKQLNVNIRALRIERDEDGRLRFALRSQYGFERGRADKGFTRRQCQRLCRREPNPNPRERLARRSRQ